jgi:hypothetical protein
MAAEKWKYIQPVNILSIKNASVFRIRERIIEMLEGLRA